MATETSAVGNRKMEDRGKERAVSDIGCWSRYEEGTEFEPRYHMESGMGVLGFPCVSPHRRVD